MRVRTGQLHVHGHQRKEEDRLSPIEHECVGHTLRASERVLAGIHVISVIWMWSGAASIKNSASAISGRGDFLQVCVCLHVRMACNGIVFGEMGEPQLFWYC